MEHKEKYEIKKNKAEELLVSDYLTSEFSKINRLITGQPVEPVLNFSEKYKDRKLEYPENREELDGKLRKLDGIVGEVNRFAEMTELAEKGSATRKVNEENMLAKIEEACKVAFGEENGKTRFREFKNSYEGLAKALGL